MKNIPFKKTYYDDKEVACVKDALLCNTDYSSKVKEMLTPKCENIFLTSSGSTAFDLLFCALGLENGSEVIMPSYTFPSVANTVLRAGLTPVFAEIDMQTKALDISDTIQKITPKTRCIVPTHYGGSSVDMDKLKATAKDILLIEDAALSFGALYKGEPLGTIGDMGIMSFHHTKNISSDEGGMLIVDEKHDALIKKIQTLYDNGTNKLDFLGGKADCYTWQQAGMNVAMPNVSAAVLFAQLEKAQDIRNRQKRIFEYYHNHLADLCNRYSVVLPYVPEYNQNNYHVFYILFENQEIRERVRQHCGKNGVQAYFHYMPLHSSNMGKSLGYQPDDLPITQSVSERILRLPIYADMSISQCEKVVSVIKEVLCRN